jgi:hypothetical protein
MKELPISDPVYDFLAKTKYQWTDDMREISGFGGGYEATCRAMVSAGMEWFDTHPDANPEFHTYQNITGLCMEDNKDAKDLSEAIVAVTAGDCTGAMHEYSIWHILKAHREGWSEYQQMSRKLEKENK